MEDENGLELRLGLSFGGSSIKPKGKNGSSLDTGAEEVDRGGNKEDDFKNFVNAGNQRTYPSKPEENFFGDLGKAKEDNASINLNGRGLWFADNNKHSEFVEDKQLETGNKRKMFFDEINNQKKRETEVRLGDLRDSTRTSHTSVAEDGSKAKNEDEADSEAENLTTTHLSLNNDGSRRFMRVGGSSGALNEVFKVSDSSMTDLNGQQRFIGTSNKDFKLANLTCGASSPQMPGMIRHPMMDKDNSRGFVFHPQHLHPSFAGTGPPNSVSNNISEVMPFEERPLERSKGDGKQHVLRNSSSQIEDVKGRSTNIREKDASDQSTREGFSIDFSTIKPGLAAEVKFGGSGSLPNLPWVSTKGTGTNGRTISGVTYKYNNNQIRIVCACHGTHMSPDDFIRHANEDVANPEVGGAVSGAAANGNPSTSAHR